MRIKIFARAVLFFATMALVVQLFPRHGSFRYDYNVGQPWSYDLLTAPYDFAILKDEETLQREQEEALNAYAPYFRIDVAKADSATRQFQLFIDNTSGISDACRNYLTTAIKNIYDTGIIGSLEADTLAKAGYQNIHILQDGSTNVRKHPLSEIYTIRSAYRHIIDNRPDNVPKEDIDILNVNYFLSENLSYDSAYSHRDHDETLKQVSLTAGMVKAGDHIVNRGEIVTQQTFQILESLKYSYANPDASFNANTETVTSRDSSRVFTLIGDIIGVSVLFLLLALYLFLFRPAIFDSTKNVLFILLTVLIPILLASLTLRFTKFYIYIVPFALVPIIVRTFFDARTALFAHIITSLITAFFASSSFAFALFQITAGMTAVSSLKDLTTRAQMAHTALYVFLTYAATYIAYCLMIEGDPTAIKLSYLFAFFISSILLLFSYGFIFIFEKTFGYTSAVTLMELSNTSRSLLQKLSEDAPGTFQHATMVANLIAPAAKAINADSLVARVGALYHDIGKVQHPEYFTENQSPNENPLSELPLQQAASLIIAHVADGVTIAKAQNLPKVIIDFIRTHHGDSVTKYFYNTYVNTHNGERPDEGLFRYGGPKPFTKEQALLMMADSIEAASRSVVSNQSSDNLEQTLDKLVDSIIDQQMQEGLFADAPITFQQINIVRQVFKNKLHSLYHSRIAYPTIKDEEHE